MSNIAEKRTDEIVGEYHDGDYTDHSRHNTRWCSFREGYDQSMQDFLEKACEWIMHNNNWHDGEVDLNIKSFKNYMQNED